MPPRIIKIKGLTKNDLLVTISILLLLTTLVFSCSQYSTVKAQGNPSLTTQGLMAWWKLNEGSGTAVSDSSSNSNYGTITGCSWVNEGGTSCLSFNGQSDYVSLPSVDLTSADSMTVVAWINSDLSKVGFIVYHGDLGEFELGNGDLSQESQSLNLNPTYAEFSVKLSDSNWYRVSSTSSMQPNVWHQIVAVWIQGSSLKIYIDGVLAAENDDIENLGLYDPGSWFPSSLGIYAQNQWGVQDWFKGQMSNVMVYNRALGTSEIQALYTSQVASIPSSTATATSPTPTPTSPTLPTPNLSFNCISSTTTTGFNVQIQGSLTYNGVGIADTGIQLFDSVTGGATWQDLTYVITDNNGSFSCVWMPSVSGIFGIEAAWSGDNDYSSVNAIYNFAVAPFDNQNVFSVTSNSTLTSLMFDSTNNELSFGVSGPSGTTGLTTVCIPQSLIPDISRVNVMLNGTSIDYTSVSQGNVWLITFTYHHSSHTIVIALGSSTSTVLQFALSVILSLVLIFAVALVVLRTKTKNTNIKTKIINLETKFLGDIRISTKLLVSQEISFVHLFFHKYTLCESLCQSKTMNSAASPDVSLQIR